MPGKTIHLYVADEKQHNLMTAEIGQWTGLACIGERIHVKDIATSPDFQKPAVYILTGKESDDSLLGFYVGEADEVGKRIKEQAKSPDKSWFDRFIIMMSKDDNMTKAHVKYLEKEIYELAEKSITTLEIKNGNKPGGAKLPISAQDEMAVYKQNMVFMLKNLGLIDFTRSDADQKPKEINSEIFYLALTRNRKDKNNNIAQAKMILTEDGYRLLQGSYLEVEERDSFKNHNYYKLRRQLEDAGLFDETELEGLLQLNDDVDFTSPSAAAAVVKNRAVNGKIEWKTAAGISLADFESGE